MKTVRYIVLVSILFLLPVYSHSTTLGDLRISLIEEDVQVMTEDTGDWVPASINMPLKDGDRIWVPEGGRTEIQIRDGTALRLDQESALEILTIDRDGYQFYLTEGSAYANFRGLKGSLLQIDTPLSSVRAYDRAIFRIDVTREGETDTSVYRGSVNAEGESGRTMVDEGETLSIGEGLYAEIASLGPSDDWEKWNRQRDRKLSRRPPSRHLPEELRAYSSDFDDNGRWVYAKGYGYVWTPSLVVSVGWAPYQVGRWVWIGGDYVWVSYEPWGWVPYHYGRWAFVVSIGWCWVPPARGAIYWGPGFVGWVYTPTYVSWVPLAPGEIYYGYGYYGPHSVNILNVNINVTKVVYKNVHVHNAVTVVHHDTFVRGKYLKVTAKENPFLKNKANIGRPSIKPEKATVMPVIKQVRHDKKPPQTVREVKVKELKQNRPLVREKGASVLKPKSPPKEMTVKPREADARKGGERKPVGDRSKTVKPGEEPVKRRGEMKRAEREFRSAEKPERPRPAQRDVERRKYPKGI
jgi:hypothetical protein